MSFYKIFDECFVFVNNNIIDLCFSCCSYVPSQGDTVVFEAITQAPPADLPHALRWYNHISSYGAAKASFPGSKKDLQSYGGGAATNGVNGTKKKADDDDDDFDLFGSDSEEVSSIHCFQCSVIDS